MNKVVEKIKLKFFVQRTRMERLISRWKDEDYEGRYLKVFLQEGLCNKLYCLFSACEIAIKHDAYIIEPYFGWQRLILFSDIYDINYFNERMKVYHGGHNLIISKDEYRKNRGIRRRTIVNHINLWDSAVTILEQERERCAISKDSMKLKVLAALKLKPEHLKLIVANRPKLPFTAIQVRTESDWESYAKKLAIEDEKEILLIKIERLIEMLNEEETSKDIFFTTGQNHQHIARLFEKSAYRASYYYNPDFEYEINAAINFEICCMADVFVGLSRSTYSNLIALKRATLLNNDNSFIYNYDNRICKRVDKGLQAAAKRSVAYNTTML